LKKISVLLLLFMLTTVLFSDPAAAEEGFINLIPSTDTVKKNMIFEVDIQADNMDNLYGLQLHLNFDSSQLEIIDFRPDFFGWERGTQYYEFHRWDNDRGTFDMVFTCCGSDVYFSGSGKLGTIEFRVIGTDTQLKIIENQRDKSDRACLGVDNQSQPSKYKVYQATIHNDNSPPDINNIEVIDNSTIRIEFNEPLENASALDVNNYIIEPDLGIRSIQLDESQRIVTLVTDPQVGNRLYELNVLNIQDLMGNRPFDVLRKYFRGSMRLWLEAVDPIYKRNTGTVKLKAGPVEEMTQLIFYIKYDGNYLTYTGVRCDNENFSPQVTVYPEASYMYFLCRLDPGPPVSRYDDWVVCEFDFMPQNVGSTKLEFMTGSKSPEAYGKVNGISERIVVETSDAIMDILQSYTLTGYVKLVVQKNFSNVSAYRDGDESKEIDVDTKGKLQLENLIPGIYTIRLFNPGYLPMDYYIDVQCDTEVELHMIPGDLNDDWLIDICDIAKICKKFSTKKGSDGWESVMDYNCDEWIDVVDISIVARNYGRRSNIEE